MASIIILLTSGHLNLNHLKQTKVLDKIDTIVADAGYGSEYNYYMFEDKYEDKDYYIPYTLYKREQTSKYKKDPTKLINRYYNEKDDYCVDYLEIKFNQKNMINAKIRPQV